MQQQDKFSHKSISPQTQTMDEALQSFDWFTHMRNNHPVVYDEQMGCWNVFRYDDVYQVITDYQTYSSEHVPNFSRDEFLGDTIVAQDPPNHHRLRNLIKQAFTPHAINHLKDDVIKITQELLNQARARGHIEIVSDLAFPLTAKIDSLLIGVPDQDFHLICQWIQGSPDHPLSQTPAEKVQEQNQLGYEIYDYFSRLLIEYRRTPHENLLSTLSRAELNGERLSDDELVRFCLLLMAAGQQTVQNLIINAAYCLIRYPESYAQLIQQPALMPSTIDEVLRYLPPFWIAVRRTLTDAELGGQRIPANTIIQAWTASANRDSTHFVDAERFAIQRQPNHHLTFGHGIHFCIGAPLARMEAHIALQMMLDQLKNVQRIPDKPIVITPGPIHAIYSLPLMFEA